MLYSCTHVATVGVKGLSFCQNEASDDAALRWQTAGCSMSVQLTPGTLYHPALNNASHRPVCQSLGHSTRSLSWVCSCRPSVSKQATSVVGLVVWGSACSLIHLVKHRSVAVSAHCKLISCMCAAGGRYHLDGLCVWL